MSEIGKRKFCAEDLAIENVGNKSSLRRRGNVLSCNKTVFLPLLCKVSRARRCFKPTMLGVSEAWG